MPPIDSISFQDLRAQVFNLEQEVIRIQQIINRPIRPIYIPVSQFSGYLSDSFLGSGTSNLEQINSLGIIGARIEAAGDACDHLWCVPKDFNVDTNIKLEVVWTTNSVDTSETATWKAEYSASADGEALAAASTALDEVITADTVLGAYKVHTAPYGAIFGGNLQHGDFVHLKISLDSVSGLNPAADLVYILGILINDQ